MMFRAIVIMVVLLAVAASNKHVGLTAALLYAAAYTMSSASRCHVLLVARREPK